MADPYLSELNSSTLQEIYPRVIRDNFFRNAPLLAYLRANCLVPYRGGAAIQGTFAYAPLNGGFYKVGQNFNIGVKQVLAGTLFEPRYVAVPVSEYKETIDVVNKGPHAVFRIIDAKLRIAMNTISAIADVAVQRHGQVLAGDDRSAYSNGLCEAFNDGVTPSPDGNVFTSYGLQTRNGAVGSTLNSVPMWCGKADGSTAPISYNQLLESWADCCISGLSENAEEPNLGLCNKAVWAYILERIQPQQRFQMERDPIFGATGFKFMNAMILKDDYFLSSKYGQNDPILGSWLTGKVTPAAPAAASGFPTGVECTIGEVFAWINTKTLSLHVTDSQEYGFGWSGFYPTQDNTRVSGQVKAAFTLKCDAPRLNKFLCGIGG
jgi:hypothetical protein